MLNSMRPLAETVFPSAISLEFASLCDSAFVVMQILWTQSR